MPSAREIEREIQVLADRIAADLGLAVYDLVFRRSGPRWKLQLFVERPGGGVSLADCEQVSRALSRELDLSDPIPHAYDLEVSSPGIERVLRLPSHWAQAAGSQVQVRFREKAGAARTLVAVVLELDGEVVVLNDGSGTPLRLPLGDVVSARMHMNWP